MDASKHALLDPASLPGASCCCCCWALKHILATPHAVSLDTTSHSPSLARIRHSSCSSRSVIFTSGSGITYGFR
uniref:Uncharacterized protein n=1 Tax=Kalanchoe fedtschenkoi TaxID=63787 RepID=A0A7N0T6E6_KALFE